MKRVFIGHRGTGKSSLLKRHMSYFPDIPHFDLDAEIENHSQKKISDIFINEGEAQFRKYEKEIFEQLIDQDHFVVAVGGGFSPQNIPQNVEVIYVSRRTDSEGRIFLNRPKINSALSDLEDSKALYNTRDSEFRKRANFIYHMSEGVHLADQIEQKIFSECHFSNAEYYTVSKHQDLGFQFQNIELRTDHFSTKEILDIIDQYPDKNFLVSYRTMTEMMSLRRSSVKYDWALELGHPPGEFNLSGHVVSVHDGSINQGIAKLHVYNQAHLKLCPVITTWSELIQGYDWQQVDPENRSFLPRTSEGKSLWRWFRLLMLNKQKVNFVQGLTENDDQPSAYEVFKFSNSKNFGAVLGFPVHHSRSVIEQNVLSIPIEEKDFLQALPFLEKMGLRYAAVTSPLKALAGQWCDSALEFNSLVCKEHHWQGTSTDHFGFQKLIEQMPADLKKEIVVWGGQGVLSALQNQIPHLSCYSARTGDVKSGAPLNFPEVLIWAAPRKAEVKFPWQIHPEWKPQLILDLNYTDNSMGIECAKHYQANYISGLEMFLEQARHQRKFWKDNL